GVYEIQNTKCIKGEKLYFTISFNSERGNSEKSVSLICYSPNPDAIGTVNYGKDMQFSFMLNPLSLDPIQMVYDNGIQPPMNIQSSSLGNIQSPQTQISWFPSGANVKTYRVYTRRDDYPKFDLLSETNKTSIITPHPWLNSYDRSNTSRDFMKLWHYAVTAVDGTGKESPTSDIASNHNSLVALFDATPGCGPAPLTVHFIDRSFGKPSAWSWDFDLSDSVRDSTQQNPTKVFTKEGVYAVELVAGGLQGTDTYYNLRAVEVNNGGTCSN
ncbi:MAG: PKD domain-containing protein, partial [Patescibacteria group bacterium]